jgi:hypothetical protein
VGEGFSLISHFQLFAAVRALELLQQNLPKTETSPNTRPLDARAARFPCRAEDTLCCLAAP